MAVERSDLGLEATREQGTLEQSPSPVDACNADIKKEHGKRGGRLAECCGRACRWACMCLGVGSMGSILDQGDSLPAFDMSGSIDFLHAASTEPDVIRRPLYSTLAEKPDCSGARARPGMCLGVSAPVYRLLVHGTYAYGNSQLDKLQASGTSGPGSTLHAFWMGAAGNGCSCAVRGSSQVAGGFVHGISPRGVRHGLGLPVPCASPAKLHGDVPLTAPCPWVNAPNSMRPCLSPGALLLALRHKPLAPEPCSNRRRPSP